MTTDTPDCVCGHTRNYHVVLEDDELGACGYGRGRTCRTYEPDPGEA